MAYSLFGSDRLLKPFAFIKSPFALPKVLRVAKFGHRRLPPNSGLQTSQQLVEPGISFSPAVHRGAMHRGTFCKGTQTKTTSLGLGPTFGTGRWLLPAGRSEFFLQVLELGLGPNVAQLSIEQIRLRSCD